MCKGFKHATNKDEMENIKSVTVTAMKWIDKIIMHVFVWILMVNKLERNLKKLTKALASKIT